MAPTSSKTDSSNRPSTLQTVKSFSRYEPATSPLSPSRTRASTVQVPESATADIYPVLEQVGKRHASDVFEKGLSAEEQDNSPVLDRLESMSDLSDELPIELASLTDRSAYV